MYQSKQFLLSLCAILLFGLILVGCGANPQQTSTLTVRATMTTPENASNGGAAQVATVTPLETASATALSTFNSPTPTINQTWVSYKLTNPPTGTPIVEANGSVTWHPQKELAWWTEYGNDGNSYQYQHFSLFWDGTFMQPGNNDLGAPNVSKLSNDEICKLLNTANAAGFFEENTIYNFPFGGAGGESMVVNGWKSKIGGAELLGSAILGQPYYSNMFCRNCPLPSEGTIIRPGLANMYYTFEHYQPEKRHVAPVEKINLHIEPSEHQVDDQTWLLASISLEKLWEKCLETIGCTDSGMIIDGDLTKEIIKNLPNGLIFSTKLYDGYPSVWLRYKAVWPDVPEVPQDYTLTCNVNGPTYPILPLNPQQKFWYYAPGGQWAAERMEGENKMRVVNTSGYEKIYGYDAKGFGQENIQIFPRYWSKDGQFFYVNILPANYTSNKSLVNSIGLQKIDVKNEKVSYVFIGTEQQSFAYNISGDGKRIASIRQGDQPLRLKITDAFSGEEKSAFIASQYVTAGSLFWYEDKLYFAATYQLDGKTKTDVLMVNAGNPAMMKVVYTGDDALKLRDNWGYIGICPLGASGDDNCYPTVNLETGEIKN